MIHSCKYYLIRSMLVLFLGLENNFAQNLKCIVYDFDGFDLNATSLPEGDYSYGDLTYVLTSNPLAASPVIGDRVLRLNLNWANNYAAFGRGISKFIEFDRNADYLNFYFYNPSSNNQNADMDVTIADDDNSSGAYEAGSDDLFKRNVLISANAGWQKFSLPLNSFNDSNTGGNGLLDLGFTQNQGMLLIVEFRFNKPANAQSQAQFYIDLICFSEGALLVGNTDLDLPLKAPADHCLLGAFEPIGNGQHQQIPINFEGYFSPAKKLKYVNTYLQWSYNSSSTANAFPGTSIQTLINNGYRPIITWEPMFLPLAPLDPAQPDLNDIIAGTYDSYIDAFADVMKNYTDTVILRPMHEFDGNWYPWCISQNAQDPSRFIQAWQRIVNRFRAKGAYNVKWMWCPNSDYSPYQSYNWFVSAYPGDNYVDYVATDIYNAHFPANLPWWRSFKWQATESCYYLSKYFPNKPLIICELGCRDRVAADDPSSQSKAQWYEAMDRELQSNFRKVRGLIFFNTSTGSVQNWNVTSSAAALQSLNLHVWNDDYYFKVPDLSTPTGVSESAIQNPVLYPNPGSGSFEISEPYQNAEIRVWDSKGILVHSQENSEKSLCLENLCNGVYLVQISGTQGLAAYKARLVILK